MPKDKPKSELALAREGKVGKISIEGPIGWDYFGMSFRGFKQALADLGKVDILEIEINSPGGVVTDGVAMINTLREHNATVHTYNVGQAASMGSAILLSGDKVFIPDNAMTFIHKPLNIVMGNADEMRKMAGELDKFEASLVSTYRTNFKGDDQGIHDLMGTETWFTADEMDDKFNNVVVIKSGEQKAAAHSDPLEVFGDIVQYQETILDKAVNAVRNKVTGNDPKEVDMPMTPEEKQEIVADTTTSIVAALKESGVIKEPEAKVETPAPVAKVEIEFVGDKSKPEDVQAHQAKLEQAELLDAVDFSDVASVKAYHEAIAGKKEVTPASAQATGVEPKKSTDEWSDDDIQATIDRQCGTAK